VAPRGLRAGLAACIVACVAAVSPALAQRSSAAALDRIRSAGRIKLGYRTDARPFSFRDESGNAAGYSVALCLKVVDAIKAELKVSTLSVEWVPVALADRFTAVQQGTVDLLCGADAETLERRGQVAFSIPIFPGGIGALVRADAPARLREVLSGQGRQRPNWRASSGQLLQAQTFAVIGGTTAEPWLRGKLGEFKLTAKVTPVASYDAGVQGVLDRKAHVFFGDRAILLDAAARPAAAGKLLVIDRYFTYERVALVMGRGDEAFRLVVDRALAGFYSSGDLAALYVQSFGEPDDNTLNFFRWNALQD
jgi:putrescine:ornithine antiporter